MQGIVGSCICLARAQSSQVTCASPSSMECIGMRLSASCLPMSLQLSSSQSYAWVGSDVICHLSNALLWSGCVAAGVRPRTAA
jgi:hypothetical protein